MTCAARPVITPKLGLYRSAPLAPRQTHGPRRETRLYLALLRSGMFVRTLAPSDGFDFAGYVDAVTTGLERRAERVSVVAGRHFQHLGEYTADGCRVQLGHPPAVVAVLEVATPEFLVGRVEAYRWYAAGA